MGIVRLVFIEDIGGRIGLNLTGIIGCNLVIDQTRVSSGSAKLQNKPLGVRARIAFIKVHCYLPLVIAFAITAVSNATA